MAVTALLKLAGFTNEFRYVDIAHQALNQTQPMLAKYPQGFGQWLQALAYALSKPREITIVGDPDCADTPALLTVIRDGYRPFQVVALGSPHGQRLDRDDVQLAQARQLPSSAADDVGSIAAVPLLQDQGLAYGLAAAYVCDAPVPGRALACKAPVTNPLELEEVLSVH